MNQSNEDVIIRQTIAASISIIAENTPLKTKSVKSTFVVTPEQDRMLDLICKITARSRQDSFSDSLDNWIDQQLYLLKVPIEKFKANP